MPNVKVVKALLVLLIISPLCSPLLSFPVNAATGIILIEKTSAPSPPGQNIPYGGNVNLYFGTVTFSGAQFYIYLSRDGLGTISPGDLNFGLTINVADVGALSVTAISNSRIGFGWANASLPSNIAGGNYFAKALDGGSVAVTDTYFIVTSQFNPIPTSGPGGAYVGLM